jgi:hypothetical protein
MKKSVGILSVIILTILLIPFILMQFTKEVNWSLFDFFTMGFLLFIFGLVILFAFKKVVKTHFRILVLLTILIVFLLVWAELSVGIFNSYFKGN